MILGGCCTTDKINEDKDGKDANKQIIDSINEQHHDIELFLSVGKKGRHSWYTIKVKHNMNEVIYSICEGIDEENATSIVLSKEECNKLEELIANVKIWDDSDVSDYYGFYVEYGGDLTVRRGDEVHAVEIIFPYKEESNIPKIAEKLIELSPIEIK